MDILTKLLFTDILFVVCFGGCLVFCIDEESVWMSIFGKGFVASICCLFATVLLIVWTV